jgi:hypothetical protein
MMYPMADKTKTPAMAIVVKRAYPSTSLLSQKVVGAEVYFVVGLCEG